MPRAEHVLLLTLSAWLLISIASAFTPWGLDRQLVNSLSRGARSTDVIQHGDTVIGNVQVYNIFWSSDVAYQSTLNAFLSSILQSTYMEWLVEYSTSQTTIGRGSFIGSTNLGLTQTSVTQSIIISEIQKLLSTGKIPQPNINTLYIIYFDRNTTITAGPDSSCRVGGFCGYHTALNYQNYDYPFAVIADCAGGCGDNQLDSLTATVSHELLESVTDSIPGYGWFGANTEQEIADLCTLSYPYTNPSDGTTWVVNPGWSNAAQSCESWLVECCPELCGLF